MSLHGGQASPFTGIALIFLVLALWAIGALLL
jgi:hypothetical protein